MQKAFKFLTLFVSVLLSITIISSCSPQDEDQVIAVINKELVNFPAEETTRSVTVNTNIDGWHAYPDVNWCRVTNSGNTIQISVDENKDSDMRTATITVDFKRVTRTVTIKQLGKGLQILTDKQEIPVAAKGGDIELTVTSNVETTFKLPSWIKKQDEARALMTDKKYHFSVQANKEGKIRTGQIIILQKDVPESEAIKQYVRVEQGADGANIARRNVEISPDIKLKVASATADQAQSGAEIEKSYDGNMSTNYHSPFYDQTKMPVTLTYNFAKAENVDYITYYPRQSGTNGNFKVVDIYVSRFGTIFRKIMTKDFEGSSYATTINFDNTIKAKSIRFVVRSGAGYGNSQFAACAEMEFYRNSPDKFDYKTLFQDELCTKLKPSITMNEINQCKNSFFKDIALKLYNGTYQKEFRIAEFKLRLDPRAQSKINKTNPYSLRDNPTGIEIKANEDLLVFVGDMHRIPNVKLCVQNLDKANKDGFGGKEYSLTKGLNKIKITEKGLVYLLYMTKDWNKLNTTPKLKLHFATGTVNGYYDAQNPKHKGRAKELLAAAKGQYFDIVGKYAHLTFPTDQFRAHTKSIDKLIKGYDKLVKSEMELLGLYKYNKVFKNRMYLNVMYQGHMHATHYHTAYNNTQSKNVLNENKLFSGDCWGAAHEIGHMNQTYGLKWKGMTEVTNNIMSEYITASVFGGKSRIQDESITWGNNRYTKAFNTMLVPKTVLAKAGDPFCRLVPFWQLQLYFGNVLGRTPEQRSDKGGFYPDVYEHYRNYNSVNDMGIQQTEFAYVASKIAGYNLIPFFEKWGFLSPIDMVINDYGQAKVKITQARINEIKQKVNSLGLPSLNIPLEYITDNNAKYFKNQQHVVKGAKARWSGLDIFVDNWKNVVVYEVWNKPYNSAGAKLVYAGDGFEHNGNPTRAKLAVVRQYIGENTPAYLYAVDINNQRISIPFK